MGILSKNKNIILLFVLQIITLCIYGQHRIQSVIINYETLSYSSYAVSDKSAEYILNDSVFAIAENPSNGKDSSLPVSFNYSLVEKLSEIVYNNRKDSYNVSFTQRDIDYLEDCLDKKMDPLMHSLLDKYNIDMEWCINEIKKYIHPSRVAKRRLKQLHEELSTRNSFSFTICYDNGELLTLYPQSIYDNDIWITDNGYYVVGQNISSYIESMGFASVFTQLDKIYLIIDLLGHLKNDR